MHYRLVYDVLNDAFPWFGVFLAGVPLLLAIALALEVIERLRGKPQAPVLRMRGRLLVRATPLPLAIVSFVVLGAVAAFITSHVWKANVQRKECQKWAQTGQFQVTEGTIADYRFRKAGPSFRVAGLSFDLSDSYAGFTGRFNVPRNREGHLWDGMRVRLSHRDGLILRLEIESAQEALANRARD